MAVIKSVLKEREMEITQEQYCIAVFLFWNRGGGGAKHDECLQSLQVEHRNEAPSQAIVFRWFRWISRRLKFSPELRTHSSAIIPENGNMKNVNWW